MRLALCVAVGLATAAHADITYDNITGNPFAVTWVPPPDSEFAQHIRLAAGADLRLRTLELHLRNLSGTQTYDAPIWIGLYSDAGNEPGALIAERSLPMLIPPDTRGVYDFDLTGITAPAESFWLSYHFAEYNPYFLGIGDDRYPTIGSTTGWRGRRPFPGGLDWTMSGPVGDSYGYRITSIPGPGAWAIGAVAMLCVCRRRR